MAAILTRICTSDDPRSGAGPAVAHGLSPTCQRACRPGGELPGSASWNLRKPCPLLQATERLLSPSRLLISTAVCHYDDRTLLSSSGRPSPWAPASSPVRISPYQFLLAPGQGSKPACGVLGVKQASRLLMELETLCPPHGPRLFPAGTRALPLSPPPGISRQRPRPGSHLLRVHLAGTGWKNTELGLRDQGPQSDQVSARDAGIQQPPD
ncbi:uncharacterized protein LOC144227981 isoform X2 [Crocuta crocuta]